MTLGDKLTYCKYCVNRKFDFEIGTICGLNNLKPNFIKECSTFKTDNKEISESRNFRKSYRLLESSKTKYFYVPFDKAINKTTGDLKIERTIFKMPLFYIVITGLSLLIYFIMTEQLDNYDLLYFSFFSVIVIIASISFVRKLIKDQIIIEIKEKGIRTKNYGIINWIEIIRFYIKREETGHGEDMEIIDTLILEKFGLKKLIEIDISDMRISNKKLLNSILQYHKEQLDFK